MAHLIIHQTEQDTEIEILCPMCKHTRRLVVPTEGWKAWERGRLIQDAFPNLTSEEREALITGYCQPCWDKIFAEEDEEEGTPDAA